MLPTDQFHGACTYRAMDFGQTIPTVTDREIAAALPGIKVANRT